MNNIQNLRYGNLKPATEPGINDRESSNLSGFIDELLEELNKILSESGKDRLSRLIDNYSELLCVECESAFVKGFSLGVKLTAEALYIQNEENSPLTRYRGSSPEGRALLVRS